VIRDLIAVVAALAVAGCAARAPALEGGGTVIPGGVPMAAEHTLTAGDEFEIRLPFAADYNDRVTVGMDGNVSPKQLGVVQVGGMTVDEATARLKQRYAATLKAPDLSITVRRYAPEVIYVDGWVAKPGLIRSDIPMTLERALAQAGGVKNGAKSDHILIMRKDANGSVTTYEAGAPTLYGLGGTPGGGNDPLLKSFDVVYVPQGAIAAVADFAKQYYSNIPFSASLSLTARPAATIPAPQVVQPTPAVTPVLPR